MIQKKSVLFLMPSITYANKAQMVLRRNGISSSIVRTSRNKNHSGCSYSLRLVRSVEEAKAILNKHNIPILDIYSCEG